MPSDGEVLLERDANLDLLKDRVIAVVGYGNQGSAQALNLRDSGCRVIVAARSDGQAAGRARLEGFEVRDIHEASSLADIVVILLPDQVQPVVYERSIRSGLAPGKLLLVGHGFSVHFGLIPLPNDVDVALVAPVGPGKMLRKLYLEGFG